MQVKRRRNDFEVREVCGLKLCKGPFAVYLLRKSGLGTPEAVRQIAHRWQLSTSDIRVAGLKDRHAVTIQTLTVFNGPQQDLNGDQFSLAYQGQSDQTVTAKHIVGNQFQVHLRDLSSAQAAQLRLAAIRLQPAEQHHRSSGQPAPSAPRMIVPNYFDQQRFGSVCAGGEYVAHPWCQGNYEKALYLALAEFNAHDGATDREQRAIVREHWGDWPACKHRLQRGNTRSVITYLVDHPQGFKKAVALIRRDLRSLYVAAFQAKLWNETLSRWLSDMWRPDQFWRMTSLTVNGRCL